MSCKSTIIQWRACANSLLLAIKNIYISAIFNLALYAKRMHTKCALKRIDI